MNIYQCDITALIQHLYHCSFSLRWCSARDKHIDQHKIKGAAFYFAQNFLCSNRAHVVKASVWQMTASKISLCHVNEPLANTRTHTNSLSPHTHTQTQSVPYQWEGERSPFTSCINYEWQAKGHRGRRGHSFGQNIDLYFYLFSPFRSSPPIYHSVSPPSCSLTHLLSRHSTPSFILTRSCSLLFSLLPPLLTP